MFALTSVRFFFRARSEFFVKNKDKKNHGMYIFSTKQNDITKSIYSCRSEKKIAKCNLSEFKKKA